MRAMLIAMAVLGVLVAAHAQTVPILDWGTGNPEKGSQPSWYGPTGLIYTPSALVGAPLKVRGGLHMVSFDEEQTVLNATVALTDSIEAAVARVEDVPPSAALIGGGYTNETVTSLKYKIALDRWVGGMEIAPDLAVGVWDLSDSINRSFYVVASMGVGVTGNDADSPLKVHVGFAQSERDCKVGDLKLGGLDGLFAGIEFVPTANALLQVEYDSEDINAALRYFPLSWLSVEAGLLDGEFAWGLAASTPL